MKTFTRIEWNFDFIISAAHCFQDKGQPKKTEPHEVTTIVGKHNLNEFDEEGSVDHDVLDVFLHNDWKYENDYNYDADISIILLENKVDLSKPEYVNTVCLPPPSENEPTGSGIVVGWGISKDKEDHAMTPSELNFPIISQSQCFDDKAELEFASSNRTFCAGFLNQDKAVCKGDSGGGLYKFDESKRAYSLAGIISVSLNDYKACRTDLYSIFTDVSKFVDWIKMTIENNGDQVEESRFIVQGRRRKVNFFTKY